TQLCSATAARRAFAFAGLHAIAAALSLPSLEPRKRHLLGEPRRLATIRDVAIVRASFGVLAAPKCRRACSTVRSTPPSVALPAPRASEREPCSLRRGGPIRFRHHVGIDAARAPKSSRDGRFRRRNCRARARQALRPAEPLRPRRPRQLLSRQRAWLFGCEQLPAHAE